MALQYQTKTKMPNTEKLFHYLDRSQWHNVSRFHSGFARVEIDENLKKFGIDQKHFKNLLQLVEFFEMENFIEGKSLIVPARREYKELVDILDSPNAFPRQGSQQPMYADQRPGPSVKQDYRDGTHMSPANRGGPYMSPSNLGGPPVNHTPHYHGVNERGPRAPIVDDAAYRSYGQSQKQQQQPYDAHRKPIESEYPMAQYSNAPNSGLGRERPDHREHAEMHRSDHGFDQRASHGDLWGQIYGDAAEDKFGNSTYRKEYRE